MATSTSRLAFWMSSRFLEEGTLSEGTLSDETPRSLLDDLMRFFAGSAGRAWLIVTGIGGLAGAAIWTLLVEVVRVSPGYATWVAASVVLLFLLGGSFRQWSHERQVVDGLRRKNRALELSAKKASAMSLRQRQLRADIYQMAAECRSLRDFVRSLDERILDLLLELHSFSRVVLYVPQPSPGKEDEKPSLTSIAKGDTDDTDTPKGDLSQYEQVLAEGTFRNGTEQEMVIRYPTGRRLVIWGVPISSGHADRVWGVLVVYAAAADDQEESEVKATLTAVGRTFVTKQLAWAFQRVAHMEEMQRKTEDIVRPIKRSYAVLRAVKRSDGKINVESDYLFPTPALERKEVFAVLEEHKELIARAWLGKADLTEYGADGKHSLWLVPLPESEKTGRVKRMVAILDRSEHPIADVAGNWLALSRLLSHLCCGIRDPETSLFSQAAFQRHVEAILAGGDTQHHFAVFWAEAAPQAERRNIKLKVAEALREWVSHFEESPVAMLCRYDGLCYALTLPVESDKAALSQATALMKQIHQWLGDAGDDTKIYVTVVLVDVTRAVSFQELLDAVLEAKERTRVSGVEVLVESFPR